MILTFVRSFVRWRAYPAHFIFGGVSLHVAFFWFAHFEFGHLGIALHRSPQGIRVRFSGISLEVPNF